jgi:hypothetical protein
MLKVRAAQSPLFAIARGAADPPYRFMEGRLETAKTATFLLTKVPIFSNFCLDRNDRLT